MDKVLKKVTNKLEAKLNETFLLLAQTRETIEKYKLDNHSILHSTLIPCANETLTEEQLIFPDVLNIGKGI